jgi:uncharacterized protein YbaP (TraB family)
MFKRLVSAVAALVVSAFAGQASANPPLWVIHEHGATIVLFGSIHALPPKLKWEPERLKRAIAGARDLWLEIPMDQASDLAAGQLAAERGLQPEGHVLSASLSPEGRARLARVAAASGEPLAGIERLRPWMAELVLSLATYKTEGVSAEEGVERQLLRGAPASIQHQAFETPREQIDFLSSASPADQIASLEETLGELDDGSASYNRLLKAWMAGDVGALRREALDPLIKTAPGVYRTLVVDRNHRWVEAIEKRLKEPGEAVMVVGVGHLIGPDSVPALLRARGVVVEGP